MSWSKLKVGDITHVVTKGTTPTKNQGFVESGVNFIKAEALNGDSELNPKGIYHITEDVHQHLKRSILQEDDVLITIAGANIGKCGMVRSDHLPANTNQAVGIMRIDQAKADPRYIHYWFKQKRTFAFVQGLNAQAAQPNINLSMLKNIKIPLPSLAEQRKITSVLSIYDDLIDNNRRRIHLLAQSSRLLYKEWFIHLRFPDHEHVKVIDGAPEGWERRKLGELCTLRAGVVFKPKYQGQATGDYPFIKVRDMNSAGNIISITEAQNWVTSDACDEFRGRPFPPGTSVFAKIGEAIKKNRVRFIVRDTLIDNNMMGAIPNRKVVDESFLYYLLSNYDIASNASGAALPFLTVKVLSKERFLVPDLSTRHHFNVAVAPILEQITNLQRQNTEAAKARDLLLPRLMNGDIAV